MCVIQNATNLREKIENYLENACQGGLLYIYILSSDLYLSRVPKRENCILGPLTFHGLGPLK